MGFLCSNKKLDLFYIFEYYNIQLLGYCIQCPPRYGARLTFELSNADLTPQHSFHRKGVIMNKKKNFQHYSWMIIVTFFLLGILDIRFGILGFICMGAPMYHALKGEGKLHCAKYCPRGSFLGKFLQKLSLGNTLPAKYRSRKVKHLLLGLMGLLLSFSLIHSGFVFEAMAFVLLRFMFMSFMVGILMGLFFKPRSWCQVCPMGHAAALITEVKKEREWQM